ncbi:AAA family ATPase [Eubacterium limosum]|uniref:AAA family ATPase n=1 Tax=Eubacterium limosum TaxID=1736 RepID=A0ABT5UU68_EUBLI|nr:AAA family ATPase [Eubacterium limosum]MDE1472315.1 AAA family ATPase [Eubacterium limosum]
MAYKFDSVPDDLKQLPQWVVWKKETDEKGKVKKVPRNPITGYGASSTDPETWNTFITARDIYEETKGYDGIGFVFNNSGIVGVDLDHCIDETGQMTETAQEIIQVLDSYTEYSPSGTGVHIYAYGTLPVDGKKKEPYEMYQNKRYFTVTGQSFHNPPKQIQYKGPEILKIYERLFPQVEAPAQQPISGFSVLNADEVVNRIRASRQGQAFEALYQGDISAYPSQSEADMALCNMLAFWCAKDAQMMDAIFRQSGLYRPKWGVKHGPDTYGNITIQKAIAGTADVYTPKKEMYGHEIVTVEGGQNSPGVPAIPLPEVYNLHWLGQQDLKPVEFIVKGLLPVGLNLLASPPKFGKSYFVFNLAICVAGGEKFLDQETQKCGVLYLALEDSLNRLQSRAFQLLGTRDLPEGVFLMLEIGDLSNGFRQQLEAVLDKNPEIKLVIIDTLQFIRGTFNRNEGAYAVDYREMREIKAIASERNLCILLVHHTRKMKDESDPFANVSGTTGITGAMDTTLILKKDDRMKENEKTYLYITGRDVEQNAFTMSFNNGKWSIVGTVAEEEAKQEFADYMKNPTVITIRTLVNQHHGRWEGKTSELMSAGKYIAKCNLAVNTTVLGKSFGKLEDQLFKYDNILHDVIPNGNSSKKHIFFNPQLEEIEGFTEIKDSS